MKAGYNTKAAQYKKDEIMALSKLMSDYSVIGLVDVENLPSAQFQILRRKLRKDALIRMSKKELISRAVDELSKTKKNLDQLKPHIKGMPALLFTSSTPFKVSSLMRESKSKAPAKPGQIAPFDLVIPAGPTSFTPGPMISELSSVGLKTGVENGKISIRQAHVIVRAGEPIGKQIADILAKFDIQPMEIGLQLECAYEDGLVYDRETLSISTEQQLTLVQMAVNESFNLSIQIGYVTKDNIVHLIKKAFNQVKNIALKHDILSDVQLEQNVGIAYRAAKSIADSCKIEVNLDMANTQNLKMQTAQRISEEFKGEIAEEKRRRDSVDSVKIEEQAKLLKQKGTLRQ